MNGATMGQSTAAFISQEYPALRRFADAQLRLSPGHRKFLDRRFASGSPDEMTFSEGIARKIERMVEGGVERSCADYAWLCDQMLAEELHFRRHKRYRMAAFDQARREIYSNETYMTRYMNGLLTTYLWWRNHTQVLQFYVGQFLAHNPPGFSHLEIGPGHGLLLLLAAEHPRTGAAVGWDISEASIAATRAAFRNAGMTNPPTLEVRDLSAAPMGSFQSVVLSEVLEHLERPRRALESIRALMQPEARLFVNMPINSPAPDHLFNVETPEALEAFLVAAGYAVEDRRIFPATNQSLEDARRKRLTISCVFIARPT